MSKADPRFPDVMMANNGSNRSSKKGWLLGGCGCLTVLGLVCGIGGYLFWSKFVGPTVAFTQEAMVLATEDPQVKQALGEPVKVTAGVSTSNDNNSLVIRIPVSGSKGSGTVVVRGNISTDSGLKITREAATLEKDGKTIDLDPNAATPPIDQIDDGSGN